MDFSPSALYPFSFCPRQQGRSWRLWENGRAEQRGSDRLWGWSRMGTGGAGHLSVRRLCCFPCPGIHSALLLCCPAQPPGVEGGVWFVRARGCSFVCPLPRRVSTCASPPPLFAPVWLVKEGCEGNRDPPPLPSCLSLSPTLSLPCPSLENAKTRCE